MAKKARNKVYCINVPGRTINVRARSEKGAIGFAKSEGYQVENDCGPGAKFPPTIVDDPHAEVINPKHGGGDD